MRGRLARFATPPLVSRHGWAVEGVTLSEMVPQLLGGQTSVTQDHASVPRAISG